MPPICCFTFKTPSTPFPFPQVDVEGYEPFVFRSMKGLLQKYSIDHILMEYSPGMDMV